MIETYSNYSPYKFLLMASDIIVTCLLFEVIAVLRPFLPGRLITASEVIPDPWLFLVIALLWHAVFAAAGVYRNNILPDFMKQAARLTPPYLLVTFAFAGFLFFTYRDVSRMLIIYFYTVDYLVLLLIRFGVTAYLRSSWSRVKPIPIIIVGISDSALELAKTFREEYSRVFHLVGFVDDQFQPSKEKLNGSFLGSRTELPSLIEQHGVEQVFIALPDSNRQGETEAVVRLLDGLPVRVHLVPDTLKLALVRSEIEKFGDIVVIGLREPIIQGYRRVVKRIMDLVLSGLVLLVTWPLLVLIWIIVRLDSPGPALYIAERIGENGKIFKMLKFRSMRTDPENNPSQAVGTDDEGRPVYKIKGDPRVTKVGKFLRRTSMDELPQLFNVIKGEMSLVGPRPEQPFIAKGYDHWQWQRLLVPPGMTGWWQVSGRSDLPMHLNTQFDVYYVRNYNLLLDLRILVKTVSVVLNGRGAY